MPRPNQQLDAYEQVALAAMDIAAADYISAGSTDLAKWTEEERILLWKTVWMAAGESVREQLESGKAPF